MKLDKNGHTGCSRTKIARHVKQEIEAIVFRAVEYLVQLLHSSLHSTDDSDTETVPI